ncbi:hypothetical protein [Methylobacterium sp. R2-1]|uniref:hypothetical protein n=1 Tax=Methylobacterium sp. R2-1 TaxID=2587064 RepID=UPI00161B884C|nr:hypothetical protein [Methylobacterium sp. R2-1]MBB2965093.1 hypothetical protein [Methylobacterium sp. R2-1]
MPITNRFEIKNIAQAAPGELFTADIAGPSLGIALERQEGDQLVAAVLLRSGLDGFHPLWTQIRPEQRIRTFGRDWVLDLDLGLYAYPGNTDRYDNAGTIAVSDGQVVLRANGDSPRPHSRPARINLVEFRFSDTNPISEDMTCIDKWAIWLNEQERLRLGATPLFEFKPKE